MRPKPARPQVAEHLVERLRDLNAAPVRPERGFVLYWMIAARRARWNFALDRAIDRARELGKPLVVLEPLRSDYPFASERLHRFVLDGMRANRAAFAGKPVLYYPFVERERGGGKGLLAALARSAAVVVTDDFPFSFLPRMLAAAGRTLDVRLEAVDSNGLLPLAASSSASPTAFVFRRFLQKKLPEELERRPRADPWRGWALAPPPELPRSIAARWPAADGLLAAGASLAELPLDHAVAPVDLEGGAPAAGRALRRFLDRRLARYAEERNEPDAEAASGLSPWLHFGHISTHEIVAALAAHEGWSQAQLSDGVTGKREGWWGMSPGAEAFLDQLVTWRELGYHFARHVPDPYAWEALPAWARATLEEHARDPREHVYDLDAFAYARTHDELWNAAQRELLRTGRIHNYMRMVWGKKILEWTSSPREALAVMIELNDRYALDGRDPNSASGIGWTLGRFDRPWAPVRRVFGSIRYMSTANTARKLDVRGYLARHAGRGLFS
jgi:deoxyribodipyrimidine photo-lyase